MSARNEDFLFAQEAQAKGYVTETQVEEAFELQRRMAEELKIEERIAVILVKRGWMAEEQARRIYGLLEPGGGEARIEGYRLMEKVGRGAMGTVYKAIHLGLHRVVAIKVLRRELVGEKVHSERLKREAQMLAELDHPNIVRAMDAGESNGFPYVVMEFVEGETLKERINREGPLDEDDALDITRALSDALERARRMGVVHRDVKPGNILISKRGTPKLMDLGLAKGPVDLELTQHGATVGTPQFMSPEQAQEAGRADSRSDIYSLGATLYAMLTGRPPHSGTTMAEIITKVLYRQPAPIRMLRPEVSPEVSYLVERMMLKDPALRYQTPAVICEDIDRITGGRSIVPDGFTGNWEAWLLRQRLRKRQRFLTAGLIAVLVLGFGTWAFLRHRARTDARERIATLATELIAVTPTDDHTEGQPWRDALAKARKLDREIQRAAASHDVSTPYRAGVHLEALEAYDDDLMRWQDLYRKATEDQRLGQFRKAADRVEAFQSRTRFRAMATRVTGLRERVAETSILEWRREINNRRAVRPDNLEALERALDELNGALKDKRFIGTGPLLEARREVQVMHAAARQTLTALREHETRFSLETVRGEVARNELRALASRMRADRRRVEALGRSFTGQMWFAESARFSMLVDLVRPRLEEVARRVPEAIREVAQALLRESEKVDGIAPVSHMLQRLEAFVRSLRLAGVSAAEGLGMRELQARVDALASQLDTQKGRRGRILETALREVLSAFSSGTIGRIAPAVASAQKEAGAETPLAKDLRSLLAAAEAHEAVNRATLRYLSSQKGKSLGTLQLAGRDADTGLGREITVHLIAVEDDGTLRLRQKGAPSRRIVDYALGDFALAQRLAWANVGSLPSSARAWSLLAQLPVGNLAEVPDLMGAEATFESLEALFPTEDARPPWWPTVRLWWEQMQIEQRLRETAAVAAFRLIEHHSSFGDLVTVLERGALFLDPEARTWHTRGRRRHEARVRELFDQAQKQIERNKLQRWLRGAQANEGLDGVTQVEIDFTIPEALRLFRHGLGRLVDEPSTNRPISNGDADLRERRLRLLPGVEGVRRGRPLSFDNIFEPSAPMSMAFDLHTLKGAFLLAFDMDGVQLAVHSGDPNAYPEWQLPESFRLEPTDDLMAWYGRGRGVATHSGRGFGALDKGKWTWLSRQLGRNHPAWRQKEPEEGELFAFERGRAYRVRIVRESTRIALYVADLSDFDRTDAAEGSYRLIYQKRDKKWANVGVRSDARDNMRGGTGMLQILSWSEVEIDNLLLKGVLRPSWRKAREAADTKAEQNR